MKLLMTEVSVEGSEGGGAHYFMAIGNGRNDQRDVDTDKFHPEVCIGSSPNISPAI